MTIRRGWFSVVLGLLTASGCTDAVPTSEDGRLLPVQAQSIEIRLPFSAFGRDFQPFGGFSSPLSLLQRPDGPPLVATDWGGVDIRSLFRFSNFPDRIFVLPPGATATVADTAYTLVGAEVVIHFDTMEVRGAGPFQLEAGAIQVPWHPASATWDFAVDTTGNRVSWPEPGGGPVVHLDSRSWDMAVDGDSVTFAVDSETVNRWAEVGRQDRGLRVRGLSAGSRLRVADIRLDAFARSELHPDTVVVVAPLSLESTLIYSPIPELSDEAFQVGGAPARRVTFRLDIPPTAPGNAGVCALVECPVDLDADRLVYAGLELRSRETVPAGFQPLDTIGIEVRPALSPDRLPRSPLGLSVQPGPRFLAAELFSGQTETRVEIPMTRYVRDLLRGPAEGQDPVPSTLSILTAVEPWSVEFATFWGPGTEWEPTLRLILTLSEGVSLP